MPALLDLMTLHVETCYTHDARSRLLRVNEPGRGGDAPRFWIGLTRDGPVWRFRADLPDALCAELDQLCRLEPAVGDDVRYPRFSAEYLERLGQHAPVVRSVAGPAYWFETRFEMAGPAIAVTEDSADLLRGGLDDWIPDVPHQQPFFVALEDGRAVSVCASVRITEAAHGAGVETLRAYRRRGHALRVVAAWADAVIGAGRIALYSTSWDNMASRQVATRLGLSRIGTEFHIT